MPTIIRVGCSVSTRAGPLPFQPAVQKEDLVPYFMASSSDLKDPLLLSKELGRFSGQNVANAVTTAPKF